MIKSILIMTLLVFSAVSGIADSNKAAYYSWCDAGTQHKKKVDQARVKLEEVKFRDTSRNYSLKSHDADVEDAKKELKRAEDNLSDLEAEANRKNIKPGWLRCQE